MAGGARDGAAAHAQQDQPDREQGRDRRHAEGEAPVRRAREPVGEEVGGGGADAEARRVEGDGARLRPPLQAVGEQPQARHVGPGEPRSRQGVERQGRAEPVGEQGEAGVAERRQNGAGDPDPARLDAIRQAHEHRHRERVAREERPDDEARLRVAQPLQVAQRRKQDGVGGEAEHRQHLGGADDEGERCADDMGARPPGGLVTRRLPPVRRRCPRHDATGRAVNRGTAPSGRPDRAGRRGGRPGQKAPTRLKAAQ
ncbi:hypothetical protein GCM10010964_16670 [Caldovatus sediminis]|uniref:Uncharacterized protein n=1 Tax=Caldovatus sediminis TaxID=2041189 RepID=A0A8J3EBV4_9PROT|nr:hypothetical protein GCM10010964_16670 [Caldovatus sediminis]